MDSRTPPYLLRPKIAREIVHKAIVELTCAAHDMAPFARDLGYINNGGRVKSPFTWDEDRRMRPRAELDAIYFQVDGTRNQGTSRSSSGRSPPLTVPITFANLCLAYMSALARDDPDAEIQF